MNFTLSIPNLENGEEIRRLVQSIREARFKKTAEGLRSIDGNPLQVNRLSFMEINEIRPFLLTALNKAARLTALELLERQTKMPYGINDAYGGDTLMKGTLGDSQMPPYSTADNINPYSEPYNPYAFSTSQQ